MLRRLTTWLIVRSLGGRSRSWLLVWGALAGMRVAERIVRSKPRVERLILKKGDHLTIDQLAVSHRRQMKAMRAERRAARAADR